MKKELRRIALVFAVIFVFMATSFCFVSCGDGSGDATTKSPVLPSLTTTGDATTGSTTTANTTATSATTSATTGSVVTPEGTLSTLLQVLKQHTTLPRSAPLLSLLITSALHFLTRQVLLRQTCFTKHLLLPASHVS